MNKLYLILSSALCLVAFVFAHPKSSQPKPPLSIESIKSKLTLNRTTCDSLKIYFGKPIQKKNGPHLDYYFEKLDNGLPAMLSVNFNDDHVKGNTTIKSFILTQPAKGKVASAGM
jgi:hypothetical protein